MSKLCARYTVGAKLTREERLVVIAAAHREGVSVSDFVRRGINALLLEAGDEGALVEEWPMRLFQPADRELARELRQAGLTYHAIAKRIGCAESVAYSWVASAGVKG